MNIIKRSGIEEKFDASKIVTAISKVNAKAGYVER